MFSYLFLWLLFFLQIPTIDVPAQAIQPAQTGTVHAQTRTFGNVTWERD